MFLRSHLITLSVLLPFSIFAAANAQLPSSWVEGTPSPVIFIKYSSLPDGGRSCAWIDKDGSSKFAGEKEVPPGVQITGCWRSKSMRFPGFSMGAVNLEKGGKTPLEFHNHDTVMYVLSGRSRNMVEGAFQESSAGDAIFQNTGAWHQNESLSDDYVQVEIKHPHVTGDTLGMRDRLYYGIDVSKFPRQIGVLIRNADRPDVEVCAAKSAASQFAFVPRSEDAQIPKNAPCLLRKTLHARPSGVLNELVIKKGVKATQVRNVSTDTAFRVTKGRIQIEAGGKRETLTDGDAAFYAAGTPFSFEALEDTKGIEFLSHPHGLPDALTDRR